MWLFGYGSLIWRPDLEYEDSKVGYIKGHVRRFWQSSTDHRGTEEAPGRVVTLIPYEEFSTRFTDHDQHSSDQDDITWGVAYKIPESKVAETKAYLDHREKNGYETQYLDVFQPHSDTPVVEKAIVYIGATDNSEFAGPAPLDQIALQIYSSHGPSGANKDYLLNLAHSLRTVAPTGNDQHIYELEAKVKELMLRDAGSQEAFDFMLSSIILQSKPPAVSPV
ncbi:Cation transport regulator-like protein 2 [Entomortierella chlamydospora]|uniref:glutathione-specific gamma-glutamylcyclotransferase n=1 Tax=Entomortierella chlamydospora TaxID=101097 RepID=A0A9P6MSB4_9FUNG|nr:Cation transport regulator-like protein 2 [Entomortierella chlamydospora]KAG0011422.1 Cation transport regulator-like protein 2 [Entomortierella chlamydospora]